MATHSQEFKDQPPTVRARRIAVGEVWEARPTSSGWLFGPSTMGMIRASHAMRRAGFRGKRPATLQA